MLNPHHENYDPLFAYGYGLDYTSEVTVPSDLPVDVDGVASTDIADIKLYAGRTIAPWMIILSDATSFAQLSGAYAALPTDSARVAQVDKDIQGDALRMEALQDTAANIAISAGPALDWSAEYEADAAFVFDLNVADAGEAGAKVALACGEGCMRGYDLTTTFRQLEGKGWQTVTVPLSCLAEEGDSFDTVSEPFRLTAVGKADVTVANIALKLGAGKGAQCPK